MNSDGSVGQDHEVHTYLTNESDEHGPKVYVPTSMANLILQKPASELLSAKRLSTESEGKSRSLWRLSFSSEHRREGLRKLSQGSGIPVTAEAAPAASIDTPDSTLLSLDQKTDNALGVAESHLQNCCGSMDFGGVDGGTDEATTPHLHEMKISQRLASSRLQSSTSSPQLSSWGSRVHGQSNSTTTTADHSHRKRHTDNLVASIDGKLNVWSEIKLDNSPFRPKSAAPDTKHIPIFDSRFSFFSYMPGSKAARAKFKFSSSADGKHLGRW